MTQDIYFSSDTNIWEDFRTIGRLDLPFRLPYRFHIARIIFHNEMYMPGLYDAGIQEFGLQLIEVSEDEVETAQIYGRENSRIGSADCLAMSVAMHRRWILLTGDGHLRKAAIAKNIDLRGTVWILDELARLGLIEFDELSRVCEDLCRFTREGRLRLPHEKILAVIEKYRQENIS